MRLADILVEVWKQALVDGRLEIETGGTVARVGETRAKGLRCVTFNVDGHTIDGIEQNPEKNSRWAKLAQEGKKIMQFSSRHRYFANVCEGKLTKYPSWAALGLPE